MCIYCGALPIYFDYHLFIVGGSISLLYILQITMASLKNKFSLHVILSQVKIECISCKFNTTVKK